MEKNMGKYNTQLVKDFLNNNHISKASFCRQCGICLETLNQFLNGADSIGIIALVKISKFTNYSLSRLVNKSEQTACKTTENFNKQRNDCESL